MESRARQVAGSSAVVLLVIVMTLPAVAQISGGRTLNIRTSDALYVRDSNRIYAALTANSPLFPGSLVEIDPDRLSILRSTPLPTVADLVRVTPDGQYIYAVTHGAPPAVYRIDLHTMSIDLQFAPAINGNPAEEKVVDLLPLSLGQPDAFVATFTDRFDYYSGVAAFDKDRRRPGILRLEGPIGGVFPFISELVSSDTPDLIYGHDGLTTVFSVTPIRVADDGLHYAGNPKLGIAAGFHQRLQISRGLLYSASGAVADPGRGEPAGWFSNPDLAFSRAFSIDERASRVYFSSRTPFGIHYLVFDLNTFLPVAALLLIDNTAAPGDFNLPNPSRELLLTSGGDMVTFDVGNSRMLFIPTSSIPAVEPVPLPAAARSIAPYARLLEIPASQMAVDATHQRLLLTLRGNVPGIGNSLMVVDPEAGTILSRTFAGAEPWLPAASSSGQSYYVPLLGQAAVRRFRAEDLQSDLLVHLTAASPVFTGYPINAGQVLPLPGMEEAFAVIQEGDPESDLPGFDSVTVYDRDVRRPKSVGTPDLTLNSGALSRDGSMLYGLNGQDSRFEFSRIAITADGAIIDKTVAGIGSNFGDGIQCDDDFCVNRSGTVVDGSAAARTAYLNSIGLVVPVKESHRVYMLVAASSTLELRLYDATLARLISSASFPAVGIPYALCRWSEKGFAVLTNQGILLLSSDALVAVVPKTAAPPIPRGSISQLQLKVSATAYDAKRDLIYASVPGTADAYANEVVALDPASGAVVQSLPVGSDPSSLAVTDDGSTLYVALTTGDAVARVDLEAWRLSSVIPVPASPSLLIARPGTADAFFTILGQGPVKGWGAGRNVPPGLLMYRDGVALQAISTTLEWAVPIDASTIATDAGVVSVGAAGLALIKAVKGPILYGSGVAAAGGLVFGNGGSIGDLNSYRLRDQLDEYGPVAVDSANNRIYYLRDEALKIYDLKTLSIVGALPFPFDSWFPAPATLNNCGTDCVIATVAGALYIIHLGDAQWWTSTTRAIERPVDGVMRIRLMAGALQFDPARNLLYAATRPDDGALGSAVVALDPVSGDIVKTMRMGAVLPNSMAQSSDGSRLYVGLSGSRAIVSLDPDSGAAKRLPLPQPGAYDDYWPVGLAVMPGTNDVLGVTAYDGQAWWDWRQMIVNPDGTNRQLFVGSDPFKWAIGQFIFFTPDALHLQVLGATLSSFPVGPDGVRYVPPVGTSGGRSLAVCAGSVFTSAGTIYDAETLAQIGFVPVEEVSQGIHDEVGLACDADRDRFYLFHTFDQIINGRTSPKAVLHTFNLSTMTRIDSMDLPFREGTLTQMVSLGEAGVAYSLTTRSSAPPRTAPPTTDDELFIVRPR